LSTSPRIGRRSLFALLALPLAAGARAAPEGSIMVFAAASMTDALKRAAALWEKADGVRVVLSFAASSALALQIDRGARADMFLSADTDWMDFLERKGRLAPGTRTDLLGNSLVLIAAPGTAEVPAIGPGFDLAGALHGGRLALADPASVPAGKYARAALSALHVWDAVAPHLAPAENVRVALEYVAHGEAPLGIVYATDARLEPAVRIVGTFPSASHPPIIYPVALTRNASPAARRFLDFLKGDQAAAIFRAAGFSRVP